jgi:integrase
MARSIRSPKLETRSARLRLPIRWKPYPVRVAPGVRLAYRRNETAGRWSVIVANGKGGNWMKGFAIADDYEDANGNEVLDFWQAQDRARALARGGNEVEDGGKPITVSGALDAYEANLKARGGDVANVARVRCHLTPALKARAVALLTARELDRWRNGLAKKLTAGSINRTANAFRAALNLAADTDERIATRRAWEVGLQAIPDAVVSRNVILPTEQVRGVVAAAYAVSEPFGLLVETAATTGARIGQLARLEVRDLQASRGLPRLMMPSSRKGKGQKKITRRPVPIPEGLAVRLRHAGKHRPGNAPLLIKPGDEPWKKSDHTRPFKRAAKTAGLDPTVVTMYALRHSHIVNQIVAGLPIRVIAATCDTSVAMIERTYSEHIADHTDDLTRSALVDFTQPTAKNVLPLARVPR